MFFNIINFLTEYITQLYILIKGLNLFALGKLGIIILFAAIAEDIYSGKDVHIELNDSYLIAVTYK